MSNFNLNIKNLSSNKSKINTNPNLHQQPKKILLSGNGSNNQLNQPNKPLDLTNILLYFDRTKIFIAPAASVKLVLKKKLIIKVKKRTP